MWSLQWTCKRLNYVQLYNFYIHAVIILTCYLLLIIDDEWDIFFKGIHATCYNSSHKCIILSTTINHFLSALFSFWYSSKEVEVPSCNGDIAFLEVRVQQSIVEFILNHTEQIFNQDVQPSKSREGTARIKVTGAM